MHVLVGRLLKNLLDLLVGLGHVVLVLSLNVKVELPAADGHLLPQLHKNPPKRNRTVCLVLNPMEKTLVAGFLSGSKRIVVDFEVVGEKVRPLSSLLAVRELVDQLGHLLDFVCL